MKRYLFSAAALLAATAIHAQSTGINTAADAVRYSVDNLTGSARFRGMSGAFGALGGDVSAMGVNPAGSAVFNYNTGTGSLTSYNMANTSSYFGTTAKQNDNSFELNQLGAVFVFNNTNEDAKWKKFTLGFNYENTNNFDNTITTAGVNPNTNIGDYFLGYANGRTLNSFNNSFFEDLSFGGQQAYLGYNAYIFNPVVEGGSNTAYQSNIPRGSRNAYQENYMATRGYNGKIAVNFATQFKNWLYLGANLNGHITDYVKTTSFYENYNSHAATGLQSVRFNNERYTYGGGFSFNLGAIAKVTEAFRLGLAYESPTWYNLQDEITQSIVANCPQCDANNGNSSVVVDPGVTFIMKDYTIQTPSKYTGSMAYIFGKHGLVSVDYTVKDYSNTKFTNAGYNTINSELENDLDVASEIRVGAEYRIKAFSLRGGYRFEQSPYKNSSTMGDLNGFSGGLGFMFGNSRLDLAYSYFKRNADVALLSPGFDATANVKTVNNNITLSYTLDL